MVGVIPLPRNARADVRLVLMIGGNDIDLHVVLGGIEILNRHLGGRDRPGCAHVGIGLDISERTPILTAVCACAAPEPRTTASAASMDSFICEIRNIERALRILIFAGSFNFCGFNGDKSASDATVQA